MLGFCTIVIMLAIGYAYLTEGMFTGFLMCVNVLIAGLVAFNFWEPLAAAMASGFQGGFLAGYEDMLALAVLFCGTLGALRTLTNNLTNTRIEFHEALQAAGGAFFGMLTGYLTAG